MKITKEAVLNFSELFMEAEKRLDWHWNKCCDIFHRGEIICSPENSRSRVMYMDDVDYYKNKASEGDENAMGYKLIHDIMRENNVTELRIVTD